MLRIFSNIRQSLLNENKTVKYFKYAVGEVLLIMVGVILALQLNNWNQDRLNEQRERVLLQEIHNEFQFNKNELASNSETLELTRNNCSALIELFPIDPAGIDRNALAELFEYFGRHPTADLRTGSISTLVNTSSFDIISNDELRSLLLQWEDMWSDYAEREQVSREFTFEQFNPFMSKGLPFPYERGVKDERVDLSFMHSIEFENMIKWRHRKLNLMLNITEEGDRIVRTIDRIIALSDPDNLPH